MNLVLSILSALIPWVFFWRFKDTPLDRDFSPYAYPAIFKTGYLEAGHTDIKPPLVHWSYKLWLSCISRLSFPLNWKLRFLPTLALSAVLFALGWKYSGWTALACALLSCNPLAWWHMANTEWLTVSLSTLALVLPWPANLVALGLLPWVNQKNAFVALLVPTASLIASGRASSFAPIAMHLWSSSAALIVPSVLIAAYLRSTGRWTRFLDSCLILPAEFGRHRKLLLNTNFSLLRGWFFEAAPFLAIADWRSPWLYLFVALILLAAASKQVVPHHLILLAFPLALAARPELVPMACIGWAVAFCGRGVFAWWKPQGIYAVTFAGNATTNYGHILQDADTIEAWLRENTKEGEAIWVDGMENQVYLNANRPAWGIQIPELNKLPDATGAPRVVVYCASSYMRKDGKRLFDYSGYEPVLVSRLGLYTVMVRDSKIGRA